MSAWQDAGYDVERGLTGVMYPPSDMVASGPDRNFADKINYLRWEEELGHKYAPIYCGAVVRSYLININPGGNRVFSPSP